MLKTVRKMLACSSRITTLAAVMNIHPEFLTAKLLSYGRRHLAFQEDEAFGRQEVWFTVQTARDCLRSNVGDFCFPFPQTFIRTHNLRACMGRKPLPAFR